MPRTQSISSITEVSFPPSQVSGDAPPKTPIRSRLGISGLPTPFSGKKSSKGSPITKSQDASLPGTPIKSAFPTSGLASSRKSTSSAEDAYPSPSKDKDPKQHKASTILRAPSLTRTSSSNSSKDKENHSSSVAARAKARIASVLSKPSITTSSAALQAQHERSDLHLSVAGEDLVDTLRAIRARSASTISVDSVATVRASLSLERPASKKRERTDSMVSVRTMRDEPVAPNKKRERVDSTASIDSFSSVREVKPIASSNGKRQRLHSNTSGPGSDAGGASAAALAARAAVAASRVRELHKKSESEDEDEEEVLRMLSPLNTHNADVKKSTHSPLDLLRNSTKPGPLLRKESTCALITPALASARLDLKPRHQQNADVGEIPEIPSEPSSPINHARSLSDEVDASFFTMDDRPARRSGGRRNPAGEGYSLSVSLSDTAFWDITPTSTTPLTVHGTLILADPHPSYAYPPDVALDISCSVAPVQRGLGRLNRPVEMETPVDVFVDREWERVREGWSAPVELRIPPSLFGGAESRVISLLLEGNLLLPRGRGDVEIEAQAQISVSALRSNREMALSEAEKVRIEAIQKERGERERRYEEMCVEERERLMGMKYEEMSEEERERFREWMDAQEDVL